MNGIINIYKEPGFTSVQMKPVPDGRIGACSARYASAAGQIVSEWEIEKDGALRFHFEIPEGMTANITLPYYPFCAADGGTYQVGEGAYDYTYMPNCTL